MSEHLDLDALADHLAGEGDHGHHVAGCAACTDRLSELAAGQADVAASLAALPAPVVPDDLAARIEAALAAEPDLGGASARPADVVASAGAGPAALPVATGSASAATVVPLAERRDRAGHRAGSGSRRRTWLPSVAAGVVLLCGAGLGYTLLGGDGGRGGSDAEGTAAAGPAPESALVRNDSGLDYADPAAVQGALPQVLAGTAQDGTAEDGPASAGGQGGAVRAPDPLDRLRDPAGLASCLIALLPPEEPDVRPLALDYASYAGAPALAVVLPDPDPAMVSVFVVGPQCAQDADSTLFFTRLDRP